MSLWRARSSSRFAHLCWRLRLRHQQFSLREVDVDKHRDPFQAPSDLPFWHGWRLVILAAAVLIVSIGSFVW